MIDEAYTRHKIKSLKYRIDIKNAYIIKYTRFDKNGSHRDAILKLIEQKKVLMNELKELENILQKETT